MREGSEWGLPRGDIGSLVCSVRIWQHSDADTPRYLWTKYSMKVELSDWKRHSTQSTKNGPGASGFSSALEERFCYI